MAIPLLRNQDNQHSGADRFIESLEPRCLLSAGTTDAPAIFIGSPFALHAATTPSAKKLQTINYYAGAGTLINGVSPVTTGTTPAPEASTLTPPTPPSLEPPPAPSLSAPVTPGVFNAVNLISSLAVKPVEPGAGNLVVNDQTLISDNVGAVNPANTTDYFPLASDFMAINSAGE